MNSATHSPTEVFDHGLYRVHKEWVFDRTSPSFKYCPHEFLYRWKKTEQNSGPCWRDWASHLARRQCFSRALRILFASIRRSLLNGSSYKIYPRLKGTSYRAQCNRRRRLSDGHSQDETGFGGLRVWKGGSLNVERYWAWPSMPKTAAFDDLKISLGCFLFVVCAFHFEFRWLVRERCRICRERAISTLCVFRNSVAFFFLCSFEADFLGDGQQEKERNETLKKALPEVGMYHNNGRIGRGCWFSIL